MPSLTTLEAFNLAFNHHREERLVDAEELYRKILKVQPGHFGAHINLGEICRVTGRLEEAIAEFQQAISINEDLPEGHYNSGLALIGLRRYEEAIMAFKAAIKLRPAHSQAYNNLGNLFFEAGRFDEAKTAFYRAIEIKPDFAEARNNLGNLFMEEGRLDDATSTYLHALESRLDYADARLNYGLLLLLRGDFVRGWPYYEARWGLSKAAVRKFSQPMWNGEILAGKRILVHAEQGFGDAIQFVRYAPLIAKRGGKIVIECPGTLVELFGSVKDAPEVIAAGDPLPPFDVHIPMLSQPFIFRTTLKTIPNEIPYLLAPPDRCVTWARRLGEDRSRPRVGLICAGSTEHWKSRRRNISPEVMLPLASIPGVDFFSLQLPSETNGVPWQLGSHGVIDHTKHIKDFADTAALIEQLDLVISVDTAVAHLAGALGRPVWILLPFVPDWRWGLESETTPWYPTMRLFRQPALHDWDTVIKRVAEELRELAEAHAANHP